MQSVQISKVINILFIFDLYIDSRYFPSCVQLHIKSHIAHDNYCNTIL